MQLPAQPAQDAATRPGEFIHFFTNFMTLLRTLRSATEIRSIAEAAVAHRDQAIVDFEQHLHAVRAFFARHADQHYAAPQLQAWPTARIEALRAQHGGVLLAAFHFGKHREVLSDLCALGVPFVAPIARRSYFEAPLAYAEGPLPCRDAALMLEVEDRQVGRKLAMALKRGRAGLIYVDGNMGPDGHHVEEGATEIDFMGLRIRVKTGIARLANAMRLPILPLLAVPDANDPNAHRLLDLPLILPGTDDDESERVRNTMQACYDALAHAVAAAPQYWEFAFCLHRWVQVDAGIERDGDSADDALLGIDPTTVIEFPRDDGVYWLHLGRQRAYRLPDYTHALYAWLSERSRPREAVIDYLSARADAAEARALVTELNRRELLRAA